MPVTIQSFIDVGEDDRVAFQGRVVGDLELASLETRGKKANSWLGRLWQGLEWRSIEQQRSFAAAQVALFAVVKQKYGGAFAERLANKLRKSIDVESPLTGYRIQKLGQWIMKSVAKEMSEKMGRLERKCFDALVRDPAQGIIPAELLVLFGELQTFAQEVEEKDICWKRQEEGEEGPLKSIKERIAILETSFAAVLAKNKDSSGTQKVSHQDLESILCPLQQIHKLIRSGDLSLKGEVFFEIREETVSELIEFQKSFQGYPGLMDWVDFLETIFLYNGLRPHHRTFHELSEKFTTLEEQAVYVEEGDWVAAAYFLGQFHILLRDIEEVKLQCSDHVQGTKIVDGLKQKVEVWKLVMEKKVGLRTQEGNTVPGISKEGWDSTLSYAEKLSELVTSVKSSPEGRLTLKGKNSTLQISDREYLSVQKERNELFERLNALEAEAHRLKADDWASALVLLAESCSILQAVDKLTEVFENLPCAIECFDTMKARVEALRLPLEMRLGFRTETGELKPEMTPEIIERICQRDYHSAQKQRDVLWKQLCALDTEVRGLKIGKDWVLAVALLQETSSLIEEVDKLREVFQDIPAAMDTLNSMKTTMAADVQKALRLPLGFRIYPSDRKPEMTPEIIERICQKDYSFAQKQHEVLWKRLEAMKNEVVLRLDIQDWVSTLGFLKETSFIVEEVNKLREVFQDIPGAIDNLEYMVGTDMVGYVQRVVKSVLGFQIYVTEKKPEMTPEIIERICQKDYSFAQRQRDELWKQLCTLDIKARGLKIGEDGILAVALFQETSFLVEEVDRLREVFQDIPDASKFFDTMKARVKAVEELLEKHRTDIVSENR